MHPKRNFTSWGALFIFMKVETKPIRLIENSRQKWAVFLNFFCSIPIIKLYDFEAKYIGSDEYV